MVTMINPRILIGTHLAVALVAGFGGWKLRDADYQRHLKKDAQVQVKSVDKTREDEARNEATSRDVREESAKKQQQVQVVYRTVTEKVPVYVTRTEFEEKVVAGGGLPAGFVWNYNQSASNSTAPLPTGINPDTPSGVSMSALSSITAGNFALCHGWRQEVEDWHQWYNRLEAQWPGKPQASKKEEAHDK